VAVPEGDAPGEFLALAHLLQKWPCLGELARLAKVSSKKIEEGLAVIRRGG
jgi:hypothetical protein